jgi:Recombination endonuclease VII
MLKICRICKKEKDESEFPKRSFREGGRMRHECKECTLDLHAKWRGKWPGWKIEAARRAGRKYAARVEYGLSAAEFEDIETRRHKANCEICNVLASETVRGILYIDHDHATGKYRGLLCDDCNQAISRLKDSVQIVMNAAKYLERNGVPCAPDS